MRESSRVRRELEPESLEVLLGQELRAIEAGVHRFYTKDPGQPERLTATAKFVNVWKKEGGNWRIVRAVSYDHE